MALAWPLPDSPTWTAVRHPDGTAALRGPQDWARTPFGTLARFATWPDHLPVADAPADDPCWADPDRTAPTPEAAALLQRTDALRAALRAAQRATPPDPRLPAARDRAPAAQWDRLHARITQCVTVLQAGPLPKHPAAQAALAALLRDAPAEAPHALTAWADAVRRLLPRASAEGVLHAALGPAADPPLYVHPTPAGVALIAQWTPEGPRVAATDPLAPDGRLPQARVAWLARQGRRLLPWTDPDAPALWAAAVPGRDPAGLTQLPAPGDPPPAARLFWSPWDARRALLWGVPADAQGAPDWAHPGLAWRDPAGAWRILRTGDTWLDHPARFPTAPQWIPRPAPATLDGVPCHSAPLATAIATRLATAHAVTAPPPRHWTDTGWALAAAPGTPPRWIAVTWHTACTPQATAATTPLGLLQPDGALAAWDAERIPLAELAAWLARHGAIVHPRRQPVPPALAAAARAATPQRVLPAAAPAFQVGAPAPAPAVSL